MTIGPIQAFVIGFADSELFEGRIADELARLQSLTADNPAQQRRIDSLRTQFRESRQVVRARISEMEAEELQLLSARRATLLS